MKIQASSIMRLNAAWGLEQKEDLVNQHKARLPKGLSHGDEGV